MASLLESQWLYLTSNFSDFQLASLGSFVIHESVFFLAGLPYLMMECWGLQKYKIQVKALLPDSVFNK
jgi:4-alpha-methyl-delta7-sterol-4alpha-methyl oxidase